MTSLRISQIFSSVFLLMLLAGVGTAHGQTDEAPADTVTGWQYDATAGLNAAQASYRNWEEGAGTNTLSLSASVYGQAAKRADRWIQLHEVELGFGIINQEEQDVRKSEDKIQLNSNLRYQGENFFRIFNPTIAANFRSQFAKGFDYTENPFEGEVESGDDRLNRTPPVQSSAFLAPAFITESLGLTYEPYRNVTFRLGVASKQTVVREQDFRVLYGVNEDNVARVEGGAEFAAAVDRMLSENIRYRTQFNAFYAVNQTEEPPDARWQNTLTLKVNDWLSTNLEAVALFDNDITSQIQLKEALTVGVSFSLI